MSPFQTVLFKIFLVYTTMTKLMDAVLQNLQVWRANRKKQAILNKHEDNYASKVEKTFNS